MTINRIPTDMIIDRDSGQKLSTQLAERATQPKLLNGETNYTQAFDRLLTAVKTAGIKRIYLPAGTYEHDGILIDGISDLIIDGHRDAILKLSTTSTKHNIEIRNARGIRIRNITVNGNLQQGDTNLFDSKGIHFGTNAKLCSVEGVYITGTKGAGMLIGEVNQASNVFVYGTGAEGFIVGSDSQLSNCQAGVTGTHGFDFQGGNSQATSIYSWMAGNNEEHALPNFNDADGIQIHGNNNTINGFNVLASNRHGVYMGFVYGVNLSGTIDRCGRNGYYNNGSVGVYLNNAKSCIINVSVENNSYTSVDDEGWTKTAVYVNSPNTLSMKNIINATSSNVDVEVDTNDLVNLENTNTIASKVLEERNNRKIVLKGTYSGSAANSTSVYPIYTTTSLNGLTQTGGTDTIRVDKNGIYSIFSVSSIEAGTSGIKIVSLQRNGVEVMGVSPTTTEKVTLNAGLTMRLNAGDTLRIRFFQNSGTAINVTSNMEINYIHS